MNGRDNRRYAISVRSGGGNWHEWEYADILSECLERIEEALTAGESVQVEVVRLWPDEMRALAVARHGDRVA